MQNRHQSSLLGWWFQPLWKILVSWGYYSQYMDKCFKPPTRLCKCLIFPDAFCEITGAFASKFFWFLPIKTLDVFLILPSGNLLHSYWKWWFIVDLPSYNMVDLSIVFCGCLPEGKSHEIPWSPNEIYTNLHEGAMETSRNRPKELRHLTSAQTRSSTSTSSAWTTGWGVNRKKTTGQGWESNSL